MQYLQPYLSIEEGHDVAGRILGTPLIGRWAYEAGAVTARGYTAATAACGSTRGVKRGVIELAAADNLMFKLD
ncbi:MAG: hypothetical protein AAF310_06290 [Myxococcota bacterium]